MSISRNLSIFADGVDSSGIAQPAYLQTFTAGTAVTFQQTAAPTGWTKSTANNDKALRVVSGTASTGGSVAFTTAFASQTPAGTVGSTTLTTSTIPSHAHTTTSDGLGWGPPGCPNFAGTAHTTGGYLGGILGYNTGSTGSGGSHTHSFTGTAINLAVQYVDVIIATKN